METQRLTKKDSAQIVEILNRGGVVAFPTDTVYGLAVRYDLKEAILKMKEAKQRPETKPFPMMVSSKAQIERVAVTDARSQKLIDHWMPGALTLVFKKRPEIDELVTNGFPTIGIRMPDDFSHLADHHVADFAALGFPAFHLGAGHGHRFRESTRRGVPDIHIIIKPSH